jgi:hypothetical protein
VYRSCIFCAAHLGANEAVERFPVGRTMAFDARKGRLWAVCRTCARWNLAPLEERWEAVEDAERLFRDTRLRVQSENVGLAKLPDGTRLVRVGKALPGELALWRYGTLLRRRRTAYQVAVGVGVAIPVAGVVAAVAGFTAAAGLIGFAAYFLGITAQAPPRMKSKSLLPYTGVMVTPDDLPEARFAFTFHGDVTVALPGHDADEAPLVDGEWRDGWLVPSAEYARMLLRLGTVQLNRAGARDERVRAAMDLLAARGSAGDFLRGAAADRAPVVDAALDPRARQTWTLAAEMAVHADLERQAMEGELAALEAAWRQAEEIAGIADRLPDALDWDPDDPEVVEPVIVHPEP